MSLNLKYLFVAFMEDGTIYHQNPEDISTNDPTKSCIDDIDLNTVKVFLLKHSESDMYGVDLHSGKFKSGPNRIIKLDKGEVVPNKQLVYRRIVTTHPVPLTEPQVPDTIDFVFGWKGTDILTGKEVEYTLTIQ